MAGANQKYRSFPYRLAMRVAVSVVVLAAVTAKAQDPFSAGPVRHITLEQVKDGVNRASSPLARLGQLEVEAAKQHRLSVRADYFPKFGATLVNLHYTEFLGQILTVRRPFLGTQSEVPIAIFNQNPTFAALTFVQPITPLLEVQQAVRIARADERIAQAKAAALTATSARAAALEETYFKLLIAQRRLTSLLGGRENVSVNDGATVMLAGIRDPEDKRAAVIAAAKVRELSATLNRALGWPDDTELELAIPEPLLENISIDEIADKSAAANPDLVEAEQNVVKARAAARLSKLAYVPTVAAVSGYLFQNVIPAVSSNFGYGGFMASYNLFDFGKREHTIKEAKARLEMAEVAAQVTKVKVASNLQKSYLELQRSRELSKVAQKMGAPAVILLKASSNPVSAQVRAARAEVELEMLEADLAHRQAFAQVRALMGTAQ